MGHGIGAEDMAAILLLFADADPAMNMGEVMERLERFQESRNGFFGVSCRDFRLAFYQLGMELKMKMAGDDWSGCFIPDSDPIMVWIISLLNTYDHVYFNDGGESWHRLSDLEKVDIGEADFWEERDERLRRMSSQRRTIMTDYFSNSNRLQSEKTRELLHKLGWRWEILLYYLFPERIDIERGPLWWDFQNIIRWRYVFQGEKLVRLYPQNN
jgi:hypothetical protein